MSQTVTSMLFIHTVHQKFTYLCIIQSPTSSPHSNTKWFSTWIKAQV